MGKRAKGTEEAPKGLRTEDVVPPADTEKKKAPKKKLTLEERKTLYQTRLSALDKEEKAKKKAAADREARKKSRELLDRVKDAWPMLPAWDQQAYAEGIERAAETASRPGGEIPVKEEVMAESPQSQPV